jgi:hypothetical protein
MVPMSKTAIMLGKALNDSEKGAMALRKVGVARTDQQVDQIKALNTSGDGRAEKYPQRALGRVRRVGRSM